MLLNGAPHPEEGKRLIDYLLSEKVEVALAAGRSAQIPLHPGVALPEGGRSIASIRAITVDWEKVASAIDEQSDFLEMTFVDAGMASLYLLGGIFVVALVGLIIFTRSRTRKAA
jgi:iron(III) transport system substrate-binding protein